MSVACVLETLDSIFKSIQASEDSAFSEILASGCSCTSPPPEGKQPLCHPSTTGFLHMIIPRLFTTWFTFRRFWSSNTWQIVCYLLLTASKYKEGTYMLCSTHQPQCGSPELRHSPHVLYCSQDSIGTRVTCRSKKEQTEHIQSTQAASTKIYDTKVTLKIIDSKATSLWDYDGPEGGEREVNKVTQERDESEYLGKLILVESKMMISTFIVMYSKRKNRYDMTWQIREQFETLRSISSWKQDNTPQNENSVIVYLRR